MITVTSQNKCLYMKNVTNGLRNILEQKKLKEQRVWAKVIKTFQTWVIKSFKNITKDRVKSTNRL